MHETVFHSTAVRNGVFTAGAYTYEFPSVTITTPCTMVPCVNAPLFTASGRRYYLSSVPATTPGATSSIPPYRGTSCNVLPCPGAGICTICSQHASGSSTQ